nr:hypothetical protein [Abalone asfa-like virus]
MVLIIVLEGLESTGKADIARDLTQQCEKLGLKVYNTGFPFKESSFFDDIIKWYKRPILDRQIQITDELVYSFDSNMFLQNSALIENLKKGDFDVIILNKFILTYMIDEFMYLPNPSEFNNIEISKILFKFWSSIDHFLLDIDIIWMPEVLDINLLAKKVALDYKDTFENIKRDLMTRFRLFKKLDNLHNVICRQKCTPTCTISTRKGDISISTPGYVYDYQFFNNLPPRAKTHLLIPNSIL